MTKSFISELTAQVNDFVTERDWEQFHSPKNLAMAMIVEAAELVEHFQWLTQQQSAALDGQKKSAVADELADVLIYALRFADVACIDPVVAINEKMLRNNDRYPVEKSKGRSNKYNEL